MSKKNSKSMNANGRGKGYHGKSKSNRSQSKETRQIEGQDKYSNRAYGGNDISWYTRNAELTDSAARFPFAYQPGKKLNLGPVYTQDRYDPAQDYNIQYKYPGIITLNFYPSVGLSTDITSPINIAAREMYARIRSKYSGSLEADAPDIMMYVLAVDSAYMLLEDVKRAYYLINSVSPYNRYFPKTMIRALGYDYDNLLANRNELYQTIVEYGSMLKKFMVPDNMDLFKRHQFMSANIYADAPESKAQMYAFKLAGYYRLTNTDEMTTLSIRDWSIEQYKNVEYIRSSLKDALARLMDWDTAYTITGYLERAYEGEAFLVPSPVIEDAVLVPVFNTEILTQIQNASVCRVSTSSLKVTQDPTNNNVIISRPTLAELGSEGGQSTGSVTNLLTLKTTGTPTTADVVIATRLAAAINPHYVTLEEEETPVLFVSCGTEIVTDIEFWNDFENPTYIGGTRFYDSGPDEDKEVKLARFRAWLGITSLVSAFDWHPSFIFVDFDGNETRDPRSYVFSQVDNATTVDYDNMSNLHRMCIYSEFNVFR